MKITIINGNSKKENETFDRYLEHLRSSLEERGHAVAAFTLRDMDIKDCTGCYTCWVRTPGLCVLKDDYDTVIREYIRSDLVIFASPVVMSFMTSLMKRAVDRLLPLACAFLEQKADGRIGHVRRYEKYPGKGLILEKTKNVDDSDIEPLRNVFESGSGSGREKLMFTKFTSDPVEVICDETDNL